ncbi:MarR family winged helix-turn-helix transcriptional regulator [Novosphingobium cyanobacteriorum]|uniref:MarR family transcriptional regulator n=1 Tax=Novosphingobium cyanobacteriorum TaxID=3024215 RepID=A0ABT6CJF4_9SPHN|nr:MarR family transcriptional regulator [Novosphingobium cyanobacteriorum]MDF8333698.1 MarR family transcriptional regulator [Novosphingobium cyanobacteriorum]
MATKKHPEPVRMPAAAGGARDLNGWVMPGLDYPTFRLNLLCKLMDRKTLRQLAERANCTYPEWRVLSRLGCTVGGATVRQIAEAAWADRAEVSRAVASLEARGLASRLDNPQDRRAPIMFLTKAGVQLYRRVLEMRGAFHEEVMADLDAEEREALDRILGKLAHRLQEIP